MSRGKRNWHQEFIKYMNFIANHKNYSDMPEPCKEDGSIRWVVSGNTDLGRKRTEWWDKKVSEMNLPNRAEVARKIHPKKLRGMKPCQICGKKLSIFYIYPNKNTLNKLNKLSGIFFNSYEKNISEIFDILYKLIGKKIYLEFRKIFGIPDKINENKDKFIKYLLEHSRTKLSPGVMSNPPDRFDGFHTYNACCRSKEDKGRHKSNLARYSQDRRAYENWAEGNWNLSNRLMGEFKRFQEKVICPGCGETRKMTADHIGPISLGFTHGPKFNPLCNSCNSGKNNRMNYDDIKCLIEDEKKGSKIISWHSKEVWDNLKNKIKNESDALKLSKIMREHLHNILFLFALIYSEGYQGFLKSFLNPSYSFVDYKFKDFHPLKLNELKILKKPLDNKNKKKNAERYLRISFESLEQYASKENRRVKILESKKVNILVKKLFNYLSKGQIGLARATLKEIVREFSNESIKKFF